MGLSELGDIDPFQASRETTKSNKPPKRNTKNGGHKISSSRKKFRKHTQWVSETIIKGPSLTRDA